MRLTLRLLLPAGFFGGWGGLCVGGLKVHFEEGSVEIGIIGGGDVTL